MKMYEAVRKGCKKRPQKATGTYFHEDGGSCVMGAAIDGIGHILTRYNPINTLTEYWPISEGQYTERELCQYFGRDPDEEMIALASEPRNLWSALIFINDILGMDREQAADWLESMDI